MYVHRLLGSSSSIIINYLNLYFICTYVYLHPPPAESDECEAGWLLDARVGRCYRASERRASFDGAAGICASDFGARLAAPLTPDEHAFVSGARPHETTEGLRRLSVADSQRSVRSPRSQREARRTRLDRPSTRLCGRALEVAQPVGACMSQPVLDARLQLIAHRLSSNSDVNLYAQTYDQWNIGHPDATNECAVMNLKSDSEFNGRWESKNCADSSLFICSKPGVCLMTIQWQISSRHFGIPDHQLNRLNSSICSI